MMSAALGASLQKLTVAIDIIELQPVHLSCQAEYSPLA